MKNHPSTKKKIIPVLSAILLAAVLLCVTGWIFLGTGRLTEKQAVSGYFQSVSRQDMAAYKKVCYPKVWQNHYHPGEDVSLDAVVRNAMEEQNAAASDASYSQIRITGKTDLGKDACRKFSKSMEDLYGIPMKVSRVRSVRIQMDMTYTGGTVSSGTIVKYLYQYHGKWYFLSDPLLLVDLDFSD